ncbi:hypothetical protein OH491_08300 [Termitidicoccus mucosus]|uniref:hypothetical protein n=2 Tax=Termitidicoccus mucosus TaxID=1184151 RepID=UPI00318376E6
MLYFKITIQALLIILITSIAIFPANSLAVADDLSPAEKLAPGRERFKNWHEKPSASLKDGNGGLIDLNIEEHNDGQAEVTLSMKQDLALHDEINRNVRAFCARNFDEYYESIKKVSNGELSIKQTGYMKMRHSLRQGKAIRRPELLTDYGLAEAYWMFTSKIGHMNTHFTGFVPGESFYRLKEILDSGELDATPDPFPADRNCCGCMTQSTAFSWGGSTPHTEFKNQGKLLIADIRYMIKTNMEHIAYPICIRVYWSENLGRWIPWFCFEYNTVARYCNMVF